MSDLKTATAPGAKATGIPKAALVMGLLMVALAAYFALRRPPEPPLVLTPITIAVPTQLNSAPVIVAEAQGLFKKAGVEMINQPHLLGKDALKSVLEGKADLAVVADAPFMFAVLNGSDIAMLAGISQARRSLAIVARKDRAIAKLTDLSGKSLALTMGTNLPYFLDSLLQSNKIPTDKIKRVDLKTPDVISAFKDGTVDAAVVFQPFLAQLQAAMGEQMVTFFGEDVYAFRFLLVGKPGYIDSHPQEIRRILSALAAANQAIRDNRVSARAAVGAVVKVDDAIMAKLFDPQDYVLSLDQALLLALDDQTRWAMQQGLAKPGPVPNYLTTMKYQNLEAVLPSAVKIAR